MKLGGHVGFVLLLETYFFQWKTSHETVMMMWPGVAEK